MNFLEFCLHSPYVWTARSTSHHFSTDPCYSSWVSRDTFPLSSQTELDKEYKICDLRWGKQNKGRLVRWPCLLRRIYLIYRFCINRVPAFSAKKSTLFCRFTALVKRVVEKSGNISFFWYAVLSWRSLPQLEIHITSWGKSWSRDCLRSLTVGLWYKHFKNSIERFPYMASHHVAL